MSHVDDGKLNALLDGELGAEEAAAVEAHIAACPECTGRLADAKRFLAEASDLLGALELPKAAAAERESRRRVPKTAREVALDLDGATQRSPAIRPNLTGDAPKPLFARPPARRRIDVTTLAWAATVVLAIGVGFLANEVRHSRQAAAYGEGYAGRPVVSRAAATVPPESAEAHAAAPAAERNEPAPPASVAAAPAQAAQGGRARRTAASGAAPASATDLARKETPALRGKQLAAGAESGQPAGNRPGRAAKGVDVVGGVSAVAEPPSAAVVTAEPLAAAPAADRAAAAAQGNALLARAAPADQRLTAFRSADLEEAVARLGGAIRLIDGMRIDHVEVGPGWRVPGAARDRDVVRIFYLDGQGRHVVLDQQRLGRPADTSGAERRLAEIAMDSGDTLTTEAPNGQVRVRWVDPERFWLSLTATLPADSARALVGRVR
jgi:hypothetical protein